MKPKWRIVLAVTCDQRLCRIVATEPDPHACKDRRMVIAADLPFFGVRLVIEANSGAIADVAAFFHLADPRPSQGTPDIVISQSTGGGWLISGPSFQQALPVPDRASLLTALTGALERALPIDKGTFLRASAIGWNGSSVLILGSEPKLRSLFTAWCLDRGFSYFADGLVEFLIESGELQGFPAPFVLARDIVADVCALESFHSIASKAYTDHVVAMPKREWLAANLTAPLDFFVLPRFVHAAPFAVRLASPQEARAAIMAASIGNNHALATSFDALAHTKPCVEVTCGSIDQLNGTLDGLLRFVTENKVSRVDLARFLEGLTIEVPEITANGVASGTAKPIKVYEIQPATERKVTARLTIGMATFDDYDGVYFSIQALRMYHADVMDQVELLIVDNHPDGACGIPLKQLDAKAGNLRYVPAKDSSGTSVKNVVFEEAAGQYVLCMDCHVFLVPGALKMLLEYFDANPETNDLLQGPLIPDELDSVITHWEPKWRGGMFGTWADSIKLKDVTREPFDIPLMGMGLFACRKAAWLGFNKRFRGFGAEEGYIHEKFRQAGRRTLCLPFLAWMHRFNRPGGVPYRNRWQDRICNYMIGWQELGLPVDEMLEHMRQVAGAQCVEEALAELHAEGIALKQAAFAP